MAGLFDIVDRENFLNAVRRQETSTDSANPDAPLLPANEMVSQAGAVGEMQIIPRFSMQPGYGAKGIFDVAEEMGFDIPQGERTEETARFLANDPAVARNYAADYLSAMFDKFGSVDAALSAYNMGPANYGETLSSESAMPEETRNYYPNVRRFYTEATGQSFPVGISPRPQQRPSGLLDQMR
jgi:soluble lytic murein transglycosylase-like protein